MTVSVLVPYRDGCPYRESAWAWVRRRYEETHPGWEIVTGASGGGPFSRSQAILDAAQRSHGDVLVVADADVWCDPAPAVEAAAALGWAIPHLLIHRLSRLSTGHVRLGCDWHGLPLSGDNRQDNRPYKGHETGTLVVLRRDVLFDVPPDPRFVGWGQEDDAWAAALNTIVGKAWRGSDDLVHLWHPAQSRQSRRVGNEAGAKLCRRYRAAQRNATAMRALIEEAKDAARDRSSPDRTNEDPGLVSGKDRVSDRA